MFKKEKDTKEFFEPLDVSNYPGIKDLYRMVKVQGSIGGFFGFFGI